MSPQARSLGALRLPAIAVALAAAVLLAAPLIVVAATSVTESAFLRIPPQGFTLDWYARVAGDPAWTGPFWLSVGVGAAATGIAVLVGTLAAFAVERLSGGAARLVRGLLVMPLAVPPMAYAVGLVGMHRLLAPWRANLAVLILGEAVLALPFVFVLVSAALARLDPALPRAAATLGAGWGTVIGRIQLPLVVPAMAAGAVLAFSAAFDDVVLALLLLPAGTETLPVTLLGAAQEVLSPALAAASTLVSVLAVAVLGLVSLLQARRSGRMVQS